MPVLHLLQVNLMANLKSTVAVRAVLRVMPQIQGSGKPADLASLASVAGEVTFRTVPPASAGNTHTHMHAHAHTHTHMHARMHTRPPLHPPHTGAGAGIELLIGDLLCGQPRHVVLSERDQAQTGLDWRSCDLHMQMQVLRVAGSSARPPAPQLPVVIQSPVVNVPAVTQELHRESWEGGGGGLALGGGDCCW